MNARQSVAGPARARVGGARSFASVAWRALLAARKPFHAEALPSLEVRVEGVRVDPARVALYRRVCGASADGPVPPMFAHVLAGPAQLTVLTHRDYPLRVLGTVHLRNRCRQARPFRPGEVVEVLARTGEVRESPRGTEHELVTEVRDDGGDVVWSGVSTLLAVDRRLPRARPVAQDAPRHDHLETFKVPADVGRRYGRLSGDLNPIHVHPVLARLFGFPRAVAHGMWTLGRSLAALESRLPGGSMVVDVSFRRPLFIPATVALRWSDGGDEIRFAVTSADGALTHAEGAVGHEQE